MPIPEELNDTDLLLKAARDLYSLNNDEKFRLLALASDGMKWRAVGGVPKDPGQKQIAALTKMYGGVDQIPEHDHAGVDPDTGAATGMCSSSCERCQSVIVAEGEMINDDKDTLFGGWG